MIVMAILSGLKAGQTLDTDMDLITGGKNSA